MATMILLNVVMLVGATCVSVSKMKRRTMRACESDYSKEQRMKRGKGIESID